MTMHNVAWPDRVHEHLLYAFRGGGGGMHQPYAHESVIQAAWLGCVMCGSIAAAGTNAVSAAGL